ncbi:MAG: hypothetical protein CM15mP78_04910 [Candidatus Poseidoniales archaeon]|nr:MAG: hypothetical protein CM15mP78_04910 [Candidatus Poseidoniales archaeon]
MQESRVARFGTVCALYFAQGVPWFFIATVLVTFLVDDGAMNDEQKLALISAGMIPWIIGKTRPRSRDRPLPLPSDGSTSALGAHFATRDDAHDGGLLVGGRPGF